jgi:hypothetical protein
MISARWAGVVLATFLALPVAAGSAVALGAWRRRRHGRPKPWLYSFTEVGLVVGTAPWLWMILTPSGTGRAIEAVPLRGLFEQVSSGTASEQIGGNLLVFAALGFCARLRWRLPIPAIIGIAAGASLGVEALQFALGIGRVSSIDDILLNTIGAALAATVAAALQAARRADRARVQARAAPGRR